MGAHAQDDKCPRIKLGERPIDVTGNHPVEPADCTKGSVNELGCESGVAVRKMAVAPGLAQCLRQNDVGKRALRRHLMKDVVRNATRLVRLA